MESIIQSPGTLWDICPELLHQGLQTGDEHFLLMMHVAQDYCDSQRKGGSQEKEISTSSVGPRQFSIYNVLFINVSFTHFFLLQRVRDE